MNTSVNNYDAIEQLIFEENVRLESLDFHPDLDLMLVVLSTKAILQFPISSFPSLSKSDKGALTSYEIIGNGTGVHWASLDEDLSLKGFLQEALKRSIMPSAA